MEELIEKEIQGFMKLHYEPEHESGPVCWCKPKSISEKGVYHISHQQQRIILRSFLTEAFKRVYKSAKNQIVC